MKPGEAAQERHSAAPGNQVPHVAAAAVGPVDDVEEGVVPVAADPLSLPQICAVCLSQRSTHMVAPCGHMFLDLQDSATILGAIKKENAGISVSDWRVVGNVHTGDSRIYQNRNPPLKLVKTDGDRTRVVGLDGVHTGGHPAAMRTVSLSSTPPRISSPSASPTASGDLSPLVSQLMSRKDTRNASTETDALFPNTKDELVSKVQKLTGVQSSWVDKIQSLTLELESTRQQRTEALGHSN
ncbi:hypothetical protein J6590_088807 [Homalodisca vitripennis]|nr:hypothetical protein J6590_088807 [Homalodisca vitripennis]